MKSPAILVAIGLGFLAPLATAQQMSYQGRITDAAGNGVPGNQATLEFNIYSAPTGGTPVWGPFTRNADLLDSRFSIKLGPTDASSRSLVAAFEGAGPRYIEVTVAGQNPLPRQEILSTPTALHANTADVAEVARFLESSAGAAVRYEARLDTNTIFSQGNSGPFSFRSGQLGLVIEAGSTSDSAGIFLNGDTAAIYSPGDGGALLSIYDEDDLSSAAAVSRFTALEGGGFSTTGRSFITSGSDANVAGTNGYLVLGSQTGQNLVFDDNEIIARNNGAAADLFLNSASGTTRVGNSGGGLTVGQASGTGKIGINSGLISNTTFNMDMATGDTFAIDVESTDDTTMFQLYRFGTSTTMDVFGAARKNVGGTSWGTFSDERLKKDVVKYEHGLAQIAALRTVRFRYRDDNEIGLTSDAENIGFIAQEVQEVIPEAVSTDQNGYLNLNVDPIHWASVNAIQELNALVTSQGQTISAQAEENAVLKKQLADMQAQLGALSTAVSDLKASTAQANEVAVER